MGDSATVFGDAHRFSPAAPEESFVFGSCAPGWHSACSTATAVDQWLAYVQSNGIERVCCLFAGTTAQVDESHLERYSDTFGPENVCHVPTASSRLVTREKLVDEILPFLRRSVERESPVVVQCLSGVGRTGQVLAAWLVEYHEYDPVSAVETVQEMGRDPTTLVDTGTASEEELFALLNQCRQSP